MGKKIGAWHRFYQLKWAIIFIAPGFVIGLLFFYLPMAHALYLSFTHYSPIMEAPKPAGISNFIEVFKDARTWNAMMNTFYFAAGYVPVSIILSLILAVLLNMKLKGTVFFRTVFFLPSVTSGVALALVWRWLYNYNYGLVNFFLGLLGINGPDWLNDPKWAMPAVIIMSVWSRVGYNALLFLAGLQAIPDEYYEAARVDGASGFQVFWKITFPLITPTTFFLLVTGMIGALQVFTQIYVMTGGGPGNSTETVVYLIYSYAFSWFRMGRASAISWVLFTIIFFLTIIQIKFQRKWVHYS